MPRPGRCRRINLALAAKGLAEILELDEGKLLENSATAAPTTAPALPGRPGHGRRRAGLLAKANGITGIRIDQDSKRWYPQGEFLASVLGFTNVDNAGVSGLELKYDDLLTGENASSSRR